MITQITDNIYTGAFQDVSESHVYGLSSCNVADVRHLVDKAGNTIPYIIDAIRLAKSILNEHGKVLITCDMGVSRSRVVAIGLLADLGNDIDDSIALVLCAARNPELNPDLLLLLRRFYTSKTRDLSTVDLSTGSGAIVLGSKGFVGSALMKYFIKNQVKSVGLSRAEINIKDESVKLLTILESLEHSTVILCAHPPSHHTAKALSAAILLLKNTLEACRLTGKRLIYISSMAVYLGNANLTNSYAYAVDEHIEARPFGSYSESKHLCEQLIAAYRNNYGIEIVTVRPCNLYGSEMRSQLLIPKLIQKALNGEPIVTHCYMNGLPSLEFLHIDDFCKALTLIMSHPNPPQCINIGSHSLINTSDLAMLITKLSTSNSSVDTLSIHSSTNAVVTTPGFIDQIKWKPRISLEAGLLSCIKYHSFR